MSLFGLWKDKCRFCKGQENLIKTAVPHYCGFDDYYFHKSCLKKVLDNPEDNKQNLDMALEIANWLETLQKHADRRIAEARRLSTSLKGEADGD